jgi:hypothetical protein
VPPAPPSTPARALPPLAWVGIVAAVVLIATLVTLLALQLAVLADSRAHIRSQDAKITALYEAARPAARELRPLARGARPALRDGVALISDLRGGLESLREAGPTVTAAVSAVPRIRDVTTALADGTLPLVREIRASGLIGDAESTLAEIRASGLIGDAESTLAEIRAEDLVGVTARAARDAPPLVRRLIRIQLDTLTVQRHSLRVQRKTLHIQRDLLGYIKRATAAVESIDRKTGGTFPPASSSP